MDQPDYVTIARMIHLIGVVFWVGGVSFVTTVLIPSLRRHGNSDTRLELFELLEGRFAGQARIVTLVTGISGLYMLGSLEAWDRYQHIEYWWMHLMTLVWALFTVVLFFLEPVFLHKWFHEKARRESDKAFALLQRLHIILTTLSVVAILGAIAGAHGIYFS